MTEHGTVHWTELNTWQPERAKAFYAEALGWTYHGMDLEHGTYWVIMVGEKPAGGIFTMTSPDFDGVGDHWFSYFAVDDIDARVEKARAAGGTVKREPFDIPGVGRVAIVKDPNGAVAGWMTPAP